MMSLCMLLLETTVVTSIFYPSLLSLQKNVIHLSVLKLMNLRFYSSGLAGHRRIYEAIQFDFNRLIYSLLEPHHRECTWHIFVSDVAEPMNTRGAGQTGTAHLYSSVNR
jgi:hypothetical protein